MTQHWDVLMKKTCNQLYAWLLLSYILTVYFRSWYFLALYVRVLLWGTTYGRGADCGNFTLSGRTTLGALVGPAGPSAAWQVRPKPDQSDHLLRLCQWKKQRTNLTKELVSRSQTAFFCYARLPKNLNRKIREKIQQWSASSKKCSEPEPTGRNKFSWKFR